MTHLSKLLLTAAMVSFSVAAHAAPPPFTTPAELQQGSYGQGNYGPGGQTISCSSDDGKRNYCNIDTRRGVQLTRQISGSPCIQNDTWGYDNRGLWVDRGCRAEFTAGGYGPGNQWQQGQGQTITCSSDDGKRNYCNIDTRRGVQLTRQISGSPCIQNDSWGYDNRGLWVDRGCRAEFSAGSYGGGQWQQGQQGQTITCSSDDGKRNYCNIDTRRGVQLTRQISGSPCIQNDTWGYDNRGLWVDRGCRAEFSAGGYGGGTWQRGPQPQIITCSSDDGERNYCATNGLNPNSAVLSRQISGSECRRNYSWGVDRRRGLWVDHGCRAEFQLSATYR